MSNAAGWGTTASDGETWTKPTGSGMTFSIQTNGSTQVGQITGTTGAVICLLGSHTVANVGAVTQLAFSSTSDEGGLILRYPSGGNQYRIKYNGSGKLVIAKNVSNSVIQLATSNFTITANTLYTIRAFCTGSMLAAKIWASSGTEPTSWTVAINDTAFTAAGQFGLYCILAAAGDTAQFANFAVYDAPGISQDIATRTRIQAVTNRDIASRTILGALTLRDIASRLRVSAQPLRDVKTRFVLQTNGLKDLATRLILGTLTRRDVFSRTPMAIAQDTFNRSSTSGSTTISNTNGWGVFASDGEVWTKTGPGSTFQIVTNGSTQVGQITGTTNVVVCQLGRSSIGNAGATTLFAVSSTSDEAGIVLRYPSGGNQYRFCYRNGLFQIRSNVSGATTLLVSTSFTLTPGSLYYIRAYAAGSTLAAKIWALGATEPANWTLVTNDGSLSTGQFGVYCLLASAGDTAQFAQFAAYDAPGTARDILTRLLLQTPGVLVDIASRFILGALTKQDLATRSNVARAQDTFNRVGTSGSTSIFDPAGWGVTASDGETWSKTGPGSTFQIVTNGSTQVGQITGTTNAVVCQLGSTTLTNAGGLTLFAASSTSDEAGIILRYPSGGNQYRFCFRNGAVQIRKNVANVVTQLATSAFTLTPGSLYYLRALASGSTLAVKIWAYGATEPTSWTLTASDGSLQAGQFGLYCILNSSGDTAQFAQFAVYDSPGTIRDIATRLILKGLPLRDIATRLVLSLARIYDISTRALLALSQDTFNRSGTAGSNTIASSSGWGTTASDGETWSKNGTGGAGASFSIQTNGSTQVGQITGTTSATTCTLGSTSLLNMGVVVQFTVSNTTDEAGVLLRWAAGGNQYRIRYNNGHFAIARNSGGTVTSLITTTFTLTPGSLYFIRAHVTTTWIAGKIWAVGTTEPAGWTLTTVDTTLGSGQFGVYCALGATSHTAQFANFAAYQAPAQNRDIAVRLILRSTSIRDLATRLRLSSSLTQHDVGARLFLRPPTVPTPVARDVSTRLLLQAIPPLPAPGASGVQNNLFFSGEGLPVLSSSPSSFTYKVNGVALSESPVVATAPEVSGNTVSAGSVFTLLFAGPSNATQTALADGQVVSLTFVLANGQIVTGQVCLASTTTTTIIPGTSPYVIRAFGSTLTLPGGGTPDQTVTLFQVQCTLTRNLVINIWKVSTQFL